MRGKVREFVRDETGASAVEYALVAGLVAIVIVVVLTTMGTQLQALFGKLNSSMPS